jgi:hypothetical protein
MATIAIDTYKVIKRLQERGFSKDQAEALVAVAQEVDISSMATKADLTSLEVRLYKFLFAAMSAQTALIVGLLQLLK